MNEIRKLFLLQRGDWIFWLAVRLPLWTRISVEQARVGTDCRTYFRIVMH